MPAKITTQVPAEIVTTTNSVLRPLTGTVVQPTVVGQPVIAGTAATTAVTPGATVVSNAPVVQPTVVGQPVTQVLPRQIL